jgi:hypothetical protein
LNTRQIGRTTIDGGLKGYHLNTELETRWLKQNGSQKCFNHLKTGLVHIQMIDSLEPGI